MVRNMKFARVLIALLCVVALSLCIVTAGCVNSDTQPSSKPAAPAPAVTISSYGGNVQYTTTLTGRSVIVWHPHFEIYNKIGYDIKNVNVKMTLTDENGVVVGSVSKTITGPIKDKASWSITGTENLWDKYPGKGGISNSPSIWKATGEVISYDRC